MSQSHIHLQTMIKTSVQFPKDRHKTVGEVTNTKYILSEVAKLCTTNYGKLNSLSPGPPFFFFFEKAGNKIAFTTGTINTVLLLSDKMMTELRSAISVSIHKFWCKKKRKITPKYQFNI